VTSQAEPARPKTLHLNRFRAAGLHLLASAAVAAIAAILIFRIWYPSPFDEIAGGTSLFLLLVSVDVVLGPSLTLVAASPNKPAREFRRDLLIIVALQLAAFAYGVHTIAIARPVVISFEVDRFRVVTAADIEDSELGAAPAGFRSLSWSGPVLIAAVKPTDPSELLKSVDLGLAGFDLSMIPRNWRSYSSQREDAWRIARPVAKLISKYPALQAEVARSAERSRVDVGRLRFLPVMSRRASWVALIAPPDARIVGYLPVDGFF
jgi:hypothetical protein